MHCSKPESGIINTQLMSVCNESSSLGKSKPKRGGDTWRYPWLRFAKDSPWFFQTTEDFLAGGDTQYKTLARSKVGVWGEGGRAGSLNLNNLWQGLAVITDPGTTDSWSLPICLGAVFHLCPSSRGFDARIFHYPNYSLCFLFRVPTYLF